MQELSLKIHLNSIGVLFFHVPVGSAIVREITDTGCQNVQMVCFLLFDTLHLRMEQMQ